MSFRKKTRNVFGIIVGTIIAIILLDYMILNLSYAIGKNKHEHAFLTQGNTDGYVPQGMAYSEKYNIVIQTSYSSKHEPSKIFITDFSTGKLLKSYKLIDTNERYDTSHVGGVATDGKTVWITSDYSIREYNLDKLINSNSDYMRYTAKADIGIRGDFCYHSGNTLYIGDFYLEPFYDVPNNTPMLYAYNTEAEYSYANPEYVISLPKMVQGMTILPDNKFVFSTSFTNLVESSLLVYENVLNEKADRYNVNGKNVPYYKFTKKNQSKSIKIPSMAEGIFSIGNEVYVLFENCSDKYFYAFPKINHVVKYKI